MWWILVTYLFICWALETRNTRKGSKPPWWRSQTDKYSLRIRSDGHSVRLLHHQISTIIILQALGQRRSPPRLAMDHYPNRYQNLMTCSFYQPRLFHRISLQPAHNFLSNVANRWTGKKRQTNKQTLLKTNLRC